MTQENVRRTKVKVPSSTLTARYSTPWACGTRWTSTSLPSVAFEVPDDYMQKVAAMQFRQIAEYTIARFNLSDTPEALMEEWDHMARVMYSTVVEAKPHAREYLAIVEGERGETGRGYVIAADAARAGYEACRHFRLFRRGGQCRRCGRYRQGQSRTCTCWPRRGSVSSRPTAPYSRICSSACARPSPSACGCGPCMTIRPMLIGRRFALWRMVSCSTSTTRLPYCRNRCRTGIYAFGAFR